MDTAVSLLREIKEISNPPKHIAFIMDGNRRFAQNKGMAKIEGHKIAANNMFGSLLVKIVKELNIPTKELSFFAMSYDNFFKRPKEEVQALFDLIEKFFSEMENSSLLEQNLVKIQVIGDYEKYFDKKYIEIINSIKEKTKNNGPFTFNFFIMYDGQKEIVNAVQKISEKIKNNELKIEDINENIIRENSVSNEVSVPDLIVRTGGEQRLSGFCLFDSYYSEFLFLDKFWPEMDAKDIVFCMKEYSKRDRRLGK